MNGGRLYSVGYNSWDGNVVVNGDAQIDVDTAANNETLDINGTISGSYGLIPGWCGNSCTVAASNGAPNDVNYQYDSHRIPMRVALDYCW